jgi:peptidoglycan/LPS O-acetylase OafA/YrhL
MPYDGDHQKLVPTAYVQQGTYNAALDGLRFFAAMLVFFHHAPKLGSYHIMGWVKSFGWVGVDLFFTLSAYLLFSNLIREHKPMGRIDVGRFYLRRILRVYPLMALYVLAMLLTFGPRLGDWELRLAGVLLFFDNIIGWSRNYNGSIVATAHLWTLSFEFQLYLFLPLIFALFLRIGIGKFAAILAAVCLISAGARIYLFQADIGHPVVYVTPFLRPESIIAGMLMAAYQPRWHYSVSAGIGIMAAIAAFSMPVPWRDPLAAIIHYPLMAVAFAALLDVVTRCKVAHDIASFRVFVYLGTISFGFYVIHYVVRHVLRLITPIWPALESKVLFTIVMFAVTLALAAASYRFLERPFLRLKARALVIAPTRPAAVHR